jgi:hypothetical protein
MKIRIFHPIGQGAFYSERINGLNIVYDCGIQHKERSSKRVEHLITSSFHAGSIIDLLFISHFDCDHVNKIKFLHSHFPIKRIIAPLLHDEEKILISEYLKSVGDDDAANFVRDPTSWGIPVTLVNPPDPEEDSQVPERIEIGSSLPDTISSSDILFHRDWIYIPYNYDNNVRSATFKATLAAKSIDTKRLLSDPNYLKSNIKALHSAYNSIIGKINQNSLFLYSGPDFSDSANISYIFSGNSACFGRCFHGYTEFNSGCIYTGDGDLNVVDIETVFHWHFHHVGIIQIPHHGDLKSFNLSPFLSKNFICPISFGLNNNYGHPSNQLISDLLANDCSPVLVTENSSSGLYFIIK